ncbi:MAG: 50S ribosomal protein L16 [Candidatus Saganbacteria bacterium]|nr:50S ribosomal protein L16 [Candidatus Saganbacteria bacterium]
MALIPKKTKFRKDQRRRTRGEACRGNYLVFGEYGLQCLECGWLKTNQIESARKAITHHLKRGGRIWIRVLADKTYTARPAETRMGSGKGAPVGFVAPVKRGKILLEIGGVTKDDAVEAVRLAGFKLPIKTRLVEKR